MINKNILSNTDIDVNAMMSSVTGETVNGTFIDLEKERSDAERGSFINSINNEIYFY